MKEFLNKKAQEFLNQDRELLCLVKYGSHLYGTNTPESDVDFKGVYLPSKEDYLMQRVQQSFHADSNGSAQKNTSEDTDIELFSLDQFLKLACQGQNAAIEMLNANESCTLYSTPVWEELRSQKFKFLQKNMKAFVGYAMKQAGKYSNKIDRYEDIKEVLAIMDKHILPEERFSGVWAFLPENDNCKFMEQNGEKFYNVCGKMLQGTITMEYARNILEKEYSKYGSRVINSKDVDWKSTMHALRTLFQLQELYETESIKFPLKDAEYLRGVRNGEFNYESVMHNFDKGMEKVQELEKHSEFPENVDRKFWDLWLLDFLMGKF